MKIKNLTLATLFCVFTGNALQASNLNDLLWKHTTQVAVPLTLSMLAGRATSHLINTYAFPDLQQRPFFSKASRSELLLALPATVGISLLASLEHKATGDVPFMTCALGVGFGIFMKGHQDANDIKAGHTQAHNDVQATIQASEAVIQAAGATIQAAGALLQAAAAEEAAQALRRASKG